MMSPTYRLSTNLCLALAAVAGLLVPIAPWSARAATLQDPPVLSSPGASLDILMVARPQPLPFTGQPAGYTYEICHRPQDAKALRCPSANAAAALDRCPTVDDPAVSPYGGVRLQLRQGQTLRVRLVNCLPAAVDAKHAADDPFLTTNPTNLHTHGLIVEPRRADDADDPFGDYVFLLDLAPGVHPPAPGTMTHGHQDHARAFDYRTVVTDYEIPVPDNHPSGLFWFHPHVHGLALNQVTGGLAGIITIGDVHSYACDQGAHCRPDELKAHVRHIILKDTQITADYRVRFQENPAMCAMPDAASGNIGGCAGLGQVVGTTSDGNDGRWEFSVNGQTYPDVPIKPTGEIWRIANASGSASYNLSFIPSAQPQAPLVFQVLAIDGVSLVVPPGTSLAAAGKLFGGRLRVAACPGAASDTALPNEAAPPVCATSLRMMPSARAEIFIRGDATTGSAVFHTEHRMTGIRRADGDDWPSIDLAQVHFAPKPAATERVRAPAVLFVAPSAQHTFAAGGTFDGPARTRLKGAAAPVPVSTLAVETKDTPEAARVARLKTLTPSAKLDCAPMPSGQTRQVLFGLPTNTDHFGLGYRPHIALDDKQPPASAHAVKIVEFDHAAPPTVCIQLGPDNAAVTETWTLVNLAREDHNFHIHQTRFSVLASRDDGTIIPPSVNGAPVLLDNVPVPRATGDACDGTVGPWIAGTCKPTFVTVSIPFHEVGDFVYHCHILEHEDGGMMAKISVVPHEVQTAGGP